MSLVRQTLTQRIAHRCICTQRILRDHTDKPVSSSDFANPATEEQLSRNVASHSHRKAFVKWVNSKGRQYVAAPEVPGTNYLDGKVNPFPLNPQFQPQAPLSQRIKDEVYEDWRSGTGLRQLSQKYGISLERVEAILKLQEVRSRWATEGKETMTSYATSMSLMLGTADEQSRDYEARANISIDPGRQIFTLIAESEVYTPQDAAEELGKVPFAKRKDSQIQTFLSRSQYEHTSAFGKLRTSGDVDTLTVDTVDPAKPDRWAYNIKNLESGETFQRDKAGKLARKPKARLSNTSLLSKWSR